MFTSTHVHRNIMPKYRTVGSIDKKSIWQFIETIQWTCTKETFNSYIIRLEKKYSSNSSFSGKMLSSLRDFFWFFHNTWVTSKENLWYDASNSHRCSVNQGIEGIDQSVKESHTFGKRLPLGTVMEVVLRMCHEWSREDSSLLDATRKEILFSTPDGLKGMNGFKWTKQTPTMYKFKWRRI